MRILFIANANRKSAGSNDYSIDHKIYHGLVRCGNWVHWFSERDIAREKSLCGSRICFGKRLANKALIKVFQAVSPDIILMGHSNIITNETLQKLREISASHNHKLKIGQFSVDGLFQGNVGGKSNKSYLKSRQDYVDALFITTGGEILKEISQGNSKAYFIPNIVDSSIESHKNFTKQSLPIDLLLAIFTKNKERNNELRLPIAEYIEENSESFKFARYGYNSNPRISGAKYLSILGKSKMGINLSRWYSKKNIASEAELYLYSSDRISQLIGNGLLGFLQKGFNLEALFEPEKQAVFFSSKEDLLDKIKYFHRNDEKRQKIAKAGWQRAHDDYNEIKVADFMSSMLIGKKPKERVSWSIYC